MTDVAAYVPDLMDRSRIEAAAPGVRFLETPGELASAPEALVVVDLARDGVLDQLAAVPGRLVGFGAHVDHQLLAAAREAGCDMVLPRSRFFRELVALIAGHDPASGELA